MKKTILVALAFFGTEALAEEYYGYLGNCAQTAYEFKFSDGEYKAYSKNEFKMSGRAQVSYSQSSGDISKSEDGTFLMHTDIDGDILLKPEASGKTIYAESDVIGNHYYERCSSGDVVQWVAKAKGS